MPIMPPRGSREELNEAAFIDGVKIDVLVSVAVTDRRTVIRSLTEGGEAGPPCEDRLAVAELPLAEVVVLFDTALFEEL